MHKANEIGAATRQEEDGSQPYEPTNPSGCGSFFKLLLLFQHHQTGQMHHSRMLSFRVATHVCVSLRLSLWQLPYRASTTWPLNQTSFDLPKYQDPTASSFFRNSWLQHGHEQWHAHVAILLPCHDLENWLKWMGVRTFQFPGATVCLYIQERPSHVKIICDSNSTERLYTSHVLIISPFSSQIAVFRVSKVNGRLHYSKRVTLALCKGKETSNDEEIKDVVWEQFRAAYKPSCSSL